MYSTRSTRISSIRTRAPRTRFNTTQDLTSLRKKLKWRSMERGMVENEIILRKFSDIHLKDMDAATLDKYSKILDAPDPDLFNWFTGTVEVEDGYDKDLIEQIKHYVRNN